MSATTIIHGFIKWITGTVAADTAFNDLIDKLDKRLGLSVISMTTDAQPGSPTEGDVYVITGSATGAAWSTFSHYDIAQFRDGVWSAEAPKRGQMLEVQDTGNVHVWNGTSYATVSGSGFLTAADIDTLAELNAIVTDATIASQAYVDAALVGLVDLQGDYNASTNTPDLDSSPSGILKGDAWEVSTAGTFFTEDVEVGDFLIAKQDAPTTLAHWVIVNKNIDEPGTKYVGVNDQTGTTYTLVLADAGKLVTLSNAAAITLTIPANSSVAFPVGTKIDLLQKGAGQVTVAITTDTLNGNTKINAQWEAVSLVKIASTQWVVIGGVA